jgi:hypothetical protein
MLAGRIYMARTTPETESPCPPEGAKVDVVKEDDDGCAVVTHRGKTWWVDGERVR